MFQGEHIDGPHYLAMTELRVKLRKTEEVVASITQDKADGVSAITQGILMD